MFEITHRGLAALVAVGVLFAANASDADAVKCTANKYTFKKGKTTLKGDTRVTCSEIIFEDGAEIFVTSIAGVPGTLTMIARKFTLKGKAVIDGTGAKGTDGRNGDPIAHSEKWTSQGKDDYESALRDCQSVKHADHGKDGSAGGDGGPGAIITFSKNGPANGGPLTVLTGGGPPGQGGSPSGGRLYVRGDNSTCNQCTLNCPAGNKGADGKTGPAGKVVYQ